MAYGDKVVYIATHLGITCLCAKVGIVATLDGERLVDLHRSRLARPWQRQTASLYQESIASLGIGNSLLLLSARLVLCGDLLAQFALARCGGGFCGLQLVARGIGLCRHGLMGSLSVGDGGLRLLDGLLGGGK